MNFYEIEMITFPKILFAVTAEVENYKNQFRKRQNYLEIALIEHGNIHYQYSNGDEKTVPAKALTPICSDMDCETSAVNNETQKHSTVAVSVQYHCNLHKDITPAETKVLQARITENPAIILLPFQEVIKEDYPVFLHALQKIIHYNTSAISSDKLQAIAAFFSMCGLMTDYVLRHITQPNDSTPPSARKYVDKAKSYIHTHYTEKLRVSEIAESLNISEGYLYDIFKSVTGLSIIEYCNRYRVNIAVQCIDNFGLSLKDAAAQVGIDDPYYMSKLFKKVTGITYKEYRTSRSHSITKLL